MSNRDDSLDIFLQKLDAINSFCESRGDESQHACDGFRDFIDKITTTYMEAEET